MDKLVSERIELRLIERDDSKDIFAYRSDPEINRCQTWKPKTVEDVNEFIAHRIVREPNIPGTWLQLAIIHKSTDTLIGDCGIHFLPDDPNQVEIGITVNKQYQRKGYAAEALALIFDYLFMKLGKHRIIASVDPDNQASAELMEKMGMRKEAHFIKSVFLEGEWVDDMVYAIIEDEWKNIRSSRHNPRIQHVGPGAT